MAHAGRQLRVIVVGAGEVAEAHWLPGAADLHARVDVIDLDRDRARSLAESSGAAVGHAASLADAAPAAEDIVVVATPPGSHGAVVREALAAGARRILVEKPPFASSEDLEATAHALSEHRTAVGVAFIRRLWGPVITGRRLYPLWLERFGALERVRVTEGRPYAWQSRAAAQQGIAGLSDMLLDELPHPLDALFRITGWSGAPTGSVSRAQLDPLDVDAQLDLTLDGVPIALQILGSRTAVLPNALDLGFERGSVTIEMSPGGGIIVRPSEGERTLIRCDDGLSDVEPMVAAMLRSLAEQPLSDAAEDLEAWRGPMGVIELLKEDAWAV